jgi:chromosomal replication initiator protein
MFLSFMPPAIQNVPSRPFFDAVERRLSKQAFETWFRPLKLIESGSTSGLKISAPNALVKEWILTQYSQEFEESLNELELDKHHIEWVITEAGENGLTKTDDDQSRCQSNLSRSVSQVEELQYVDRTIATDNSVPTSLSERYTFERFVVASCNRFAHAAAQAVAESPGRTYNPLYLYGGVGLGKTHLIQAAGHAIRQTNSALRIAYLSLERFMNELITAIRYGYDKTEAFRARYRNIDVLLIDDIQFIAGKERTQEEFFHTFNALYEGQKQIVLTSDCPPREIPQIEERLHSRFEWGLIADIGPPDLETKVAILRKKAELQGVTLPDDVALYIANKSKHNIRELEGALVRVLAMSSLRGMALCKSLAEDALGGFSRRDDDDSVSVIRIQKACADYYRTTVEALKARSNARPVLLPRQVAMYICKCLTKKSYPEIARHFGGKHHTTVIHSVEKINRLMSTDAEMNRTINRLIDSLKN